MALNLIDEYVGTKIRLRRSELGIGEKEFAIALETTVEKLRDYEKGISRIGAKQLAEVAKMLDVPPKYFFVGLMSEDDE